MGTEFHLPAVAAKADRNHTYTLGGRRPGCNDLARAGTLLCNWTNRGAAALLRYLWSACGQSLPIGSGKLIGPTQYRCPLRGPITSSPAECYRQASAMRAKPFVSGRSHLGLVAERACKDQLNE